MKISNKASKKSTAKSMTAKETLTLVEEFLNNKSPKTVGENIVSITFVDANPLGLDDYKDCPFQPYLSSGDDNETIEPATLTEDDRAFFQILDEDLFNLWDNFGAAGFALSAIKNQGLYRFTHPTFAAYCKDTLNLDVLE
jgi:hypothetical protein